ncbi:GGDEF domain-containing protein [Porticoccus sp. W117]|uniref:GGDEF domain-containing protein n=1 Tax=Porticoccus sp. W117 TaxID=3054777 RepID=UPI0025913634|nr:GGDEF domain-containing protein [Porticoccus sp. W117]MDM3870803.1 GGDEF domain-containing protein [Porticoccus sp. W117]
MSPTFSANNRVAVLSEQVNLLYRSSVGSVISSLGLMVFTAVALWGVAPSQGVLRWGLAHGVLAAVRLLWVRYYLKGPERLRQKTWTLSFLLLVFLNGVLWGALLSMYSVSWPLPHQFITWIIYPGVIAGSVITLSAYFPAFIAFVAPLVVSCAWALLSIDGNEYGMLLMIMAIFFACVLLAAQKYNATLVDAIETKRHLQAANRKLAQMATQDALTGVPNRRAFEYQLQREWGRSQRRQGSLALLMVDVDHFKEFNDRFGHTAGDLCLKEVAAAITKQLQRPTDLASRFGGEEFALLLPDTDREGAMVVAENILQAVRQVRIPGVEGQDSAITVSVGVGCCIPQRGEGSEQLLEAADQALYRAKDAGRDRAD